MARKPIVNTTINGNDYFRTRLLIGTDKEGKKIYKNFYGKSKGEAESLKKDYTLALEKGINPDLGSMQFDKAIHDWLWTVERSNGNKSSTFERHESTYRNYVEESMISKISVSQISKIILLKYYNDLLESGKSYKVLENLHKFLSKFFRYALSEGYVVRNPLVGLKLPKEDEDEIEDHDTKIETMSDEEIKRILDSIGNKKLKYIVMFAFMTGARMGEILALEKQDIKGNVVRINKSLRTVRVYEDEDNYKYELKVTRPKTKSSNREVPLPETLRRELKNLNLLVKEEKLKLGPAYEDNDLLFPSITGTYIEAKNLRRSWERALKKAAVPHKKFHSLRHTYATRMIENDVQLLTVSRLLGHSSIKTTEIYAHTLEDTKFEAVKTFDAMFN
jgi:integrase